MNEYALHKAYITVFTMNHSMFMTGKTKKAKAFVKAYFLNQGLQKFEKRVQCIN